VAPGELLRGPQGGGRGLRLRNPVLRFRFVLNCIADTVLLNFTGCWKSLLVVKCRNLVVKYRYQPCAIPTKTWRQTEGFLYINRLSIIELGAFNFLKEELARCENFPWPSGTHAVAITDRRRRPREQYWNVTATKQENLATLKIRPNFRIHARGSFKKSRLSMKLEATFFTIVHISDLVFTYLLHTRKAVSHVQRLIKLLCFSTNPQKWVPWCLPTCSSLISKVLSKVCCRKHV